MHGQELRQGRCTLSQLAKAKAAGLDVDGRNAYVCEDHYKQFKKGNKKADQIEKWRHGI